jgi:hypothetical protein
MVENFGEFMWCLNTTPYLLYCVFPLYAVFRVQVVQCH